MFFFKMHKVRHVGSVLLFSCARTPSSGRPWKTKMAAVVLMLLDADEDIRCAVCL